MVNLYLLFCLDAKKNKKNQAVVADDFLTTVAEIL